MSTPASTAAQAVVSLELATAMAAVQLGGRRRALQPVDALLLAWLALEGSTPRERLATLLWPESDAAAARNALRQRLHRLRASFGVDLVTGTPVLGLAPGVSHDLDTDTTPDLLGDAVATDAPELQAWLTRQRAARQSRARSQAEARIEALEEAGDTAAALQLTVALLDADPLSEDTHRRLMRLHYLRGDRAGALLAFDRCEQMLKHEVGGTPSSATLALLQTLQQAGNPAEGHHGPRPPAALLRPPRLIGRDVELQTLRQAIAGGGIVLLIGEAGIGKSRLIQALTATAAPGRFAVHASGRPGDALVPYATLARALRLLLEHQPLSEAPHELALRTALAPLLPELAPSLGQPSPGMTVGAPAAPVAALLNRAAGGVAALALDDLHFADDASLDLLQALLTAPRERGSASAKPPSIGLCLGFRPPAPGSRLADLLQALASAMPHTRLSLQPLSEVAVAALVSSLALPGVQADAVAQRLHALTGGNPLFALETLKLAWVDGRLATAVAGDAGHLPHPQSLAHLIGQQLARLSRPALQLARVAAVAGVDFSIPLAETLLQRSALDLADAWSELEVQQVLRGNGFAHDLIHDAVLQGLPDPIARHLHGQMAAWLEDPRHGSEPARVASHWEAAGQRTRAVPALRQAADRAHRAWREGERIAFLLRAADIAEADARPGEAFDLLRAAVEAHMNTIRQADGLPLLDRLQALAGTPLQAAQVAGDRAWYAAVLGELQQAVQLGQAALAAALPLADAPLLASVRQRLGTVYGMSGRFDEALQQMRAAEPEIERGASPDERCEFHGNLAVLLDNQGDGVAAQDHHLRALALSQRQGDRAQHATHLANHAQSRLDAGDVATAASQAMLAQRIVTEHEIAGSSAGFVATLLATCERAGGRYAAALSWCERAESILNERNPARVPVALLQRAQIWLDLGQHARAAQLLGGTGLEAARQLPPRYAVRWLTLLARLQRRLGRPADVLLAEAADRAPARGFPELGLIVRTEQALRLEPDRALAELDAITELARTRRLHGVELAALQHSAVLQAGADAALLDPVSRRSRTRRAVAGAAAIVALSERAEALHADRALRWLAPALAWRSAGRIEDADRCATAGRAWLAETAATQMEPAFVDGFLHQHPVNRLLQTWVGAADPAA